MTLAFSRIYYAMAVEGHFFKSHAKLSRRGVPSAALISQAVIAIILVCLRNLDQLTSMVVFVGMIFNVMTLSICASAAGSKVIVSPLYPFGITYVTWKYKYHPTLSMEQILYILLLSVACETLSI